jgi:hypothetical protein
VRRKGRKTPYIEIFSLQNCDLGWVQAALEETDAKRESRGTESIAVGSSLFIERIKSAMGAMAKGRCVQPGEGAFELRDVQSGYNAIIDHENRDIGPK